MENKSTAKKLEWLWRLGVLLPAALVFVLAAKVQLPVKFIHWFSAFKLIHFLLLTILFFLLFQIQDERLRRCAGMLLAALAFALPLAIRLSSGLSNATVLGGFVPYKDGYYYYNGATMLLNGQRIPPGGLQGAFRPLFPGLLSILLAVSGRNLLAALVIMVALTALAVWLAADCLNHEYGSLPAALFFSLTYAFIRPMIGDTLTEVPSLAFACLALVLLLRAARSRRLADAAWGGVMLTLAISIRAGAFFMLPFLILWLGWLFRGEKKFSWRMAILFGMVFVMAFGAFNILLPRLITEQSGATFGNFSWMLYGQAVGGAGFQYHLQALGTDDSAVVLQAALQKIRTYPLGLLIGFCKSYRDFFVNNSLGIFDLLSGEKAGLGWAFWVICVGLLLYGIFKSIRHIKEERNGLLLACFLGILASIPFLPPIDGGNRFYSGSVPFLFALMTVALPALRFVRVQKKGPEFSGKGLRWAAGVIALLMVSGPMLVMMLSRPVATRALVCATGQIPFMAYLTPGSYVDILPDGSPACGLSPAVCAEQFEVGGMDRANDDFYNRLVEETKISNRGIRLWAGIEYGSGQYRFFILPLDIAAGITLREPFSGCAESFPTRYQSVLRILTIN